MLKETAKDPERELSERVTYKKDYEMMIVRNDPCDPITALFSFENLIWDPNINQKHDVHADWDSSYMLLILLQPMLHQWLNNDVKEEFEMWAQRRKCMFL